jgi:hypothetical protein
MSKKEAKKQEAPQEPVKPAEVKAVEPAAETKPAKKEPYRALNVKERDMLFAFYEKWNGRITEMVLDKDCPFKAYSQIHYYKHLYHFSERLVEKKRKNAENVLAGLKDAKVLAIKQAMRILESHNVFVTLKDGRQAFDAEGKPLIVERLPYYKEIKAAWEIIKTELGEPTTLGKTDITSGGKPIQSNSITFVSFKNGPESK